MSTFTFGPNIQTSKLCQLLRKRVLYLDQLLKLVPVKTESTNPANNCTICPTPLTDRSSLILKVKSRWPKANSFNVTCRDQAGACVIASELHFRNGKEYKPFEVLPLSAYSTVQSICWLDHGVVCISS